MTTEGDHEPEDAYVNIGDLAGELGMQAQYASRYLHGEIEGYPMLAEGLRVVGESENYHSYRIHQDDVEELTRRIDDFRQR